MSNINYPGFNNTTLLNNYQPGNAGQIPGTLGPNNLNNGLYKTPSNFDQGLLDKIQNLAILSDTFEQRIFEKGMHDYRQIYSKEVIGMHEGTLSRLFYKSVGIDERPGTAEIEGLGGWEQSWNEVTNAANGISVTVRAWGRFYKTHRLTDDIQKIRFYTELARDFADNAPITLNNLAGIRLYEGANPIFVTSVAAYNPANPNAPRLTLGADASTVGSSLTWDALKEAKHLMQNYQEPYIELKADPDNAGQSIATTQYRHAYIGGHQGDSYLVLLGWNGYDQLLNDSEFRAVYVVNGGVSQSDVLGKTLGITTPVMQFKFEIVKVPITISKAANPEIATDGSLELEVAFVIGGSNGARVAIELSLEGWTKFINIGYEDSRKVDIFGLLSITGWMAVMDFKVIRNEAVYAIPYTKRSYVAAGANNVPNNTVWKA